jgi:hypothetical protein
MNNLVAFIPIFTTIFSFYFLIKIYNHYQERRKKYLFWWTLGVLTFGLGTLSESLNVLLGWNGVNLKFWYIVGALLGGFPLAQGSVYLLMQKRFADITSIIFVSLIAIASCFVILSPIELPDSFTGKLSGSVLGWTWVRLFSPIINLYAFFFLVGGAIYSAHRYYKRGNRDAPFRGNIFIAIGGLLPGIGGSFARGGFVEVLFVTEFIGLLLIYYGYRIIRDSRTVAKN